MTALDEWTVDDLARARAPGRQLRRAVRRRARTTCSTCWPAATRPTSSASCGRASCGTGWRGTLRGRAGAQRLAVTAAAPSPTAGLFGVFLPDGTRVGELDEEMVYESRPGETFLLGATHVADRGHHPRAGRRHPGAGRAGQDAVLARRRAGSAARARPGHGRVRPRAARPGHRGGRAAPARATSASTSWRRRNLAALPRRAGRGHRRRARRPHDRGRALPRRDRRLAGLLCSPRSGPQVHAPWAMALRAPPGRAARASTSR